MESIEIVVLDTDILIDHLRGFTKAKIFLALYDEQSISGIISTLTVMELLSGKSASEDIKRIKIEKLLSLFKTVDVTFSIAEKAGELRRKYSTNPIDSIIAATAISYNLKLATCNISHYQMVEGITIWKPYDK